MESREIETDECERKKDSQIGIQNTEDNPEELHKQTDAAIRKEDKVSGGQDSEDVVKNKCEEAGQKDQEPNEVDDDVEARGEEENDPGPPGEGAMPVTAANSSEECQNVAFKKPTNQSRDSLEDEFLVQKMMTGDTMVQEMATRIPHPVTDTDEADLEAPGEEEIEMLEEIPVISIRSGSQLINDFLKFFFTGLGVAAAAQGLVTAPGPEADRGLGGGHDPDQEVGRDRGHTPLQAVTFRLLMICLGLKMRTVLKMIWGCQRQWQLQKNRRAATWRKGRKKTIPMMTSWRWR